MTFKVFNAIKNPTQSNNFIQIDVDDRSVRDISTLDHPQDHLDTRLEHS